MTAARAGGEAVAGYIYAAGLGGARVITILGTGHVFDLRRRVQEEIFRRSPEMVALELDPPRFEALRHPERAKGGPPVYRLLAGFQERMAKKYGVKAGDEMLAAAEAARDLRVPIALIDRDARLVFRRVWTQMGFLERMRLAGALIAGVVLPSNKVEAELDKIQDDYDAVFAELGKKFPTVRRVVLDERDAHMAEALAQLAGQHASIVAVVGDGHVDGLSRLLTEKQVAFETVRLKALRAAPETSTEPGSVTMRVEYDY